MEIVELFVLCDQQSKTQRYLVYYHIRQRKSANLCYLVAGTREYLTFRLEKLLKPS